MSHMVIRPRLILVVLVLSLVACDQSWAQQRRSPFGAARFSLATLAPVQEELKLSDEQKQLADSLHDQFTEDRREVFQSGGGDFNAMRLKMEELDGAATREFNEKLDDAQKQRLTEIYVQANGPNSLVDEAVIDALKIDAEQQGKLEEIRETNRQAFFGAFQDFQDMSDDERREAMTKLQREADERLLAGLTAEQRTAFKELPGEEVDFDLAELRGTFGGGGGQRPANDDSGRPQRPE